MLDSILSSFNQPAVSTRCATGPRHRVTCHAVTPAYDVHLAEDLLGVNSHLLARLIVNRRVLVVTTPTVSRLFGARFRNVLANWELDCEVLIAPCTETSKSMEAVLEICQTASNMALGRKDVFVAFGGGVCSDLVTMAASLLRRGVAHIRIPTTLIGQVDAGVGIKGAVNFCGKKNSLGCYFPPEAVLIDPAFLQSLAARELSSGFAEIVKMAIIGDAALFAELEQHGDALMATGFAAPREVAQHVVWQSCQLILDLLAQNIYEDNSYERLLDFGHTFSPTLESLSRYQIPHGHAVAIDMAMSSAIACQLGLLKQEEFAAIVTLLLRLGLPVENELLDVSACLTAIEEATRHRGGQLNLVVPNSIGQASFIRSGDLLDANVLRQGLQRLDDFAQSCADQAVTPQRRIASC